MYEWTDESHLQSSYANLQKEIKLKKELKVKKGEKEREKNNKAESKRQ